MIYEARGILIRLMNDSNLTVKKLIGRDRDPTLIRKLRRYLSKIDENLSYIRLKVPELVTDN
jgi:hypothetical protein